MHINRSVKPYGYSFVSLHLYADALQLFSRSGQAVDLGRFPNEFKS